MTKVVVERNTKMIISFTTDIFSLLQEYFSNNDRLILDVPESDEIDPHVHS